MKVLTVKEAAAILNVNHNIIYDEIKRGALKASKPDGYRILIILTRRTSTHTRRLSSRVVPVPFATRHSTTRSARV